MKIITKFKGLNKMAKFIRNINIRLGHYASYIYSYDYINTIMS